MLVISDTQALYNILIKDQYTFEEMEFFLEYVRDAARTPTRSDSRPVGQTE